MVIKNDKHPPEERSNAPHSLSTTPPALPRPPSIFDVRDSPTIDPSSIPDVVLSAQDPEARIKEKQGLLKLDESIHAEAAHALDEADANQAQLAADLGKFAPRPGLAAALGSRLATTRASNVKAQTLAAHTSTQEDMAHHDALTFLIAEAKEVAHAAEHDPSVLTRYPRLMAFDAQRKQPAADGRARAKAERDATPQPPTSNAPATPAATPAHAAAATIDALKKVG